MSNFSENIVNQRFKQVFEELEKLHIIRGKSDIAKRLGTYNHVINSILKGQRNITVEQLNKLFETYSINANFIFGSSEELFLPTFNYDSLPSLPFSDKVHKKKKNNIVLVPNKAMAGYALSHEDTDYLRKLQRFSIPSLEGDLTAFEISGDSMMPTITSGDIVICEEVERGVPLRDNHVYVVVSDIVVAKRIQQIKENNQVVELRLISDNGEVYKPYTIELEEIRQILQVKCRLTKHAIS